MQKNIVLIVILFFVGSLSGIQAQQSKSPFKTWIKLQTVKDSTLLKAMLANESGIQLPLRYELSFEKEGKKVQLSANNFVALAQQTIVLDQQTLSLKTNDNYKLKVGIYYKHSLIAIDSIVSENALTISNAPKIKEASIKTYSKTKPTKPTSELEIDGLIIDETRSKVGRDFYDLFYSKWTAPTNAKDFIITIKELPSRGRMTRISLLINDNQLFTRVLQPRHDIIEALANQLVVAVGRHLQKDTNLKRQLESPDQAGSGIF